MEQLEYFLEQGIYFFVFLPFVAFFATLVWKNKQEKPIAFIVQWTKFIYILLSVIFAIAWFAGDQVPVSEKLVTVYRTEHFVFAIQFYYDQITAVYSIVGAVLLFLVSTFSRYYMHRDEGFKRFFNTILLFAFGFNLVIFSGNFETLFIGWEIIGLSSFLLISFYRNRYLPVKNGFKVISIYRLSDIALILVMWMLHHLTHQNILFTQLGEAAQLAAQPANTGTGLFIAIMILFAAAAKSAQLPFTSWLPRAMEGPTASSAIFYGSLAVHIGVFLLLRTWPFWREYDSIKIAIMVIGACTGIVATLIARRQPTVKTQIAYSSAAQIGIIFIEIALGLHILALVHFAGNAFLRTYQLLVSPSVLNYLVHGQYFHFKPNNGKGESKLINTLLILAVKEWNLDAFFYRYCWIPFKKLGSAFQFLGSIAGRIIILIIAIIAGWLIFSGSAFDPAIRKYLPETLVGIALVLILFSFSNRGSALKAWSFLLIAHLFIIAGITANYAHVNNAEILMYISGISIAGFAGVVCLWRTYKIDNDISLDRFHGYVYEEKPTAMVFLLATIGLIGFPITAAFIGVDVFFTYIQQGDWLLIILTSLCFLFIELAAIRIYCRIFLGLHKNLYHPVAFRSS